MPTNEQRECLTLPTYIEKCIERGKFNQAIALANTHAQKVVVCVESGNYARAKRRCIEDLADHSSRDVDITVENDVVRVDVGEYHGWFGTRKHRGDQHPHVNSVGDWIHEPTEVEFESEAFANLVVEEFRRISNQESYHEAGYDHWKRTRGI